MHHTCSFTGIYLCWSLFDVFLSGAFKTAVAPQLRRHVSKCLISSFLLHLTCDSSFLKVTVKL